MNFLSVPFFLGLHQLRHPDLSFWNSLWKPWQIEVLTGAGLWQHFRISRVYFSRWSDKMSESVKGAEQASVTSNILKQASVYVLCFSIVDELRLKILSELDRREPLPNLQVAMTLRTPELMEKSFKFLSNDWWQWSCSAIGVPKTITHLSAFSVWDILLVTNSLSHALFWDLGWECQKRNFVGSNSTWL